jgi:hypothetical protein
MFFYYIKIDMLKLTRNQLLLLAAVALLALGSYLFMKVENFDSHAAELAKEVDLAQIKYDTQAMDQQDTIKQTLDSEAVVAEAENQEMMADVEETRPEDLLPNDTDADAWANANPKGTGSIELKNFLEAGHHIGVNTQASNTRNSNMGLRSEPANPRTPVSIWQNSTIGPDPYRKSLDVGTEF